MEYFNSLPEEITLDIISRLPTEDVLECKLVSTSWRSLIRHPSFSKMHSHHLNHPAVATGKKGFIALTRIYGRISRTSKLNIQYFEYNDENHESIGRIRRLNLNPPLSFHFGFLGSCNGLICYEREKTFTVCNPVTRECIMIPEIKKVGMRDWTTGFGYVASTNEYKVLRILFKYMDETDFMEVYIYTLGSGNGWRNLGVFNFGSREDWGGRGYWGEGVYVNGVIYWLDYESGMIVPFDLAEEKFCENLLRPSSPDRTSTWNKIGVLDGCLSYAISLIVNGAVCWDVWLLKKKNDNHGMEELEERQSLGWSEVFRVYDQHEVFDVTKNYTVLTFNENRINIHDLEATTSKIIVDFKERFIQIFPHKNTLVSLKELGEEDTKTMESIEIEETGSHDQPFN